MNTNRLRQIQKSLINPLLVKKKENLFYLTGQKFDHRAEEYLLLTKNTAVGFGSGLEKIDWIKKTDRLKNIAKYLKPKGRLDIEYGFTYGEGEYLKYKLKEYKVSVKPARSLVDTARQIKEPEEIACIKQSMEIVEQVFLKVKKVIAKKKWTERALAEFIKKTGFRLGAEDVSFPPIVASGPNAATPHHLPGERMLRAGESIIIDFGFKYKGYCSDFTRTVFLKFAPKRLTEAYMQTEKAYNEAIGLIEGTLKGITAGKVYQKAVDVLAEKKLDRYFIHSLGHGTGLEIHELPNLSPKSKDILQDNMVFSIEPGVYIPKQGGIRIEDLVYLNRGYVRKFINIPTMLEQNIIK